MVYECLIYRIVDDNVAMITLNRPQRLNALSRQLREELEHVIAEIENDSKVKVIILTGAPRPDGRPCFCSGEDLKEAATSQETSTQNQLNDLIEVVGGRGYGGNLGDLCRRLETMGKPSIAAIDGVCTAGGLQLALCCDLRVVSETAQISELEITNLGNIGPGGLAVRLARTVGPAWAKRLMFTGSTLNGRDAVEVGLAQQVCAPDKLLDEAMSLAKRIGSMRPETVAVTKAIIDSTMYLDMEQSLRYAFTSAAALTDSEGAKAFAQDRPRPSDQER